MISTSQRARIQINEIATRIKQSLVTIPPELLDRVLMECGLQKLGKAIGDVDELDINELKKLNYQAMRTGLSDADPQMARVFMLFLENEEGKEQIGDVVINIVPHDIKDKIPEWLFKDAEAVEV